MAFVRQRGDMWQVVWKEPKRDAYGVATGQFRQRGETFDTEDQANARKQEVEDALAQARMDPGAARELASKPLGQYATEFFDGLAGTMDKETADKYRANYLLYVAPTFGPRPVVSIRVADVKKLRGELASTVSTRTGRPLSAGTIKHAISVLRMILDTAVENEAIATNPAAVKLPSLRRVRDFTDDKRYTRLTVEQVATVAHWIGSEQPITVKPSNRAAYTTTKPANGVYALAVLFSVSTGLRASELQGVELQDITLSELPGTSGLVSVRRKKRAPAWTAEPLKTANAYRNVPLDPWLADDLRAYLAVRGREKVPTGGQVEVSVFGQVKVSTPCSSCRSGTAGPDGDGEGANQSPSPPGSSIEVCEGPYGHHFCLSPARVVPSRRRGVRHHPPHCQEGRREV
jgi:integrase